MVGVKLKEHYAVEAKERQKEYHGNQHDKKRTCGNLPPPDKGKARDKAAKSVGVGAKSIDKIFKE